jgi:hypothetical protein
MISAHATEAGFRITEGVLSHLECDALLQTFASSQINRSRAGARHFMNIPQVARLANDSRLIELAEQELGGRAVPFRATLFEKSATANWLVVCESGRRLRARACVGVGARHRVENPS